MKKQKNVRETSFFMQYVPKKLNSTKSKLEIFIFNIYIYIYIYIYNKNINNINNLFIQVLLKI